MSEKDELNLTNPHSSSIKAYLTRCEFSNSVQPNFYLIIPQYFRVLLAKT